MVKKEQSYQELKQELDTILARMQHEDTDIDEALELHKQGEALLKLLEAYLADVAKKTDLDRDKK